MFLTKKDVDKHCQEVMNKCKNEKEKNVCSLNVAQQFYNVRDYESARRYVTQFLSTKDDSSVAHKLLAQCHEHFGEKEKALSEYKYSLSLDPKQPELYLKVCELYADRSIVIDKNEAKYWHDKGEAQFPYHPAIYKLKQKMFAIGDNQNGKSLEFALLDELKQKSHDPTVNAKLLNFYIDNGRIREAYDRALKKKLNFVPNLFWYQSCVQICKLYKSQLPTSLNEEFYGNYLMALERCLAWSVQDVKMRRVSIPEGVALLANFDELISEASALNNKSERFLVVINHMCGQLCFHTALILYRKAKWEDKHWSEMMKLISPLLLLSAAKRFDIRGTKEEGTFSHFLKTCIQINTYRFHQAGYILSILAKESSRHFIEKIFHFCVSSYWKERICETVYNTSSFKNFTKSSFFMKFDGFTTLPDELPKNITDNVDQLVTVTETLYPSSLHHLVWIGVQYLNIINKDSICDIVLPLKFSVKFTGSLQLSPNSSSSYAENLSKMDIEAFLYACVYCAKSLLDHQIDQNKPLASFILPADVSKLLCTPDHDLWWEYVNQMINQTIAEDHFVRARHIIQRGIENIRLVGNNVLPLHLLVLLGRTFANKATVESDSVRASALETRSLIYWKAALPQLEKLLKKESYVTSSKSMFEYQEKFIDANEAAKLIAEGKLFVGMQLVKEKNYSETIQTNESFEEPKFSTPLSVSHLNDHSLDNSLLKTVYEQNTKIIDKLETLFGKQELLSSNQFQLLETISALSKKIDDVLIMPNDCYLDALSTSERPASPHAALSQLSNASANTRPAPPNLPTAPSLVGSNFYPIPNNVQTNFPIHPFAPPAATAAPFIAPTTASFPNTPFFPFVTPTFQQPPLLPNYHQFASDAKESYPTTNRSIASSSPLGVNTPAVASTAFPGRVPMNLSDLVAANILPEFNFFQPQQPTSLLSNEAGQPSLSLPASKSSFFQPPTPSSSAVGPTGASTPPHSFQIPNLVGISVLSPSVPMPEPDEDSDEAVEPVEHDPIPDFKPIIPLPNKVDVKTGEEEETVLFESRAKLYRYVDQEWKERGVGPLKILKNKQTGRVRILMRRDTVHNICANHFLSEDMTLTTKGDRAWMYVAPDFADQKVVVEKLCVKFAKPGTAAEFFQVFNEHKTAAANKSTSSLSPKTPVSSSTSAREKTPVSASTPPVLSPFSTPSVAAAAKTSSPLAGSDDAKPKRSVLTPAVLNVSPKTAAAAAAAEQELADNASKAHLGGFTFTKPPIVTTVPETKEPAPVVDDKKKPPFASFAGFSLNSFSRTDGESKLFSSTAVSSAPAAVFKPPASLFTSSAAPTVPSSANALTTKSADAPFASFASDDKALDFSSLSKNAAATSALPAKSKEFKGFLGAGTPVFTSKLTQSAAAKKSQSSPVASILKNTLVKNTMEAANDEEFEPTAEFQPVIPLPDLIELRTGEEGLEVLYEERCKLFRYDNETGQWKERGVGKMKILRDSRDASVRLLMRREQVHKLCCNQRLTLTHEFRPVNKSEKTWMWTGQDFSQGEIKCETLSVRFKHAEQATAFKEAIDKAKELLSAEPASSAAVSSSSLPSLSDMFKRDQTKWECKECYVTNSKEDDVCVACRHPKDGVSKPADAAKQPSLFGPAIVPFDFSVNSTTSAAAAAAASDSYTFGIPPSVSSVFSFGVSPAPATTAAAASSNDSTANAAAAPVFSFGIQSPSQKSESGGLLFGNGGSVFGDKSIGSPLADSTADTKSDGSARNVSIFAGTGSASAAKSAEGTGAFPSFSFKLPQNSGDNKFNANGSMAVSETKKATDLISKQPSSDDVEFVAEINIPDEDKILAESLMLPRNYYAYKYTNKDCPGCAGCDEEDLKAAKSAPSAAGKKENSFVPVTSTPKKSTNISTTEAPNPATTEKFKFVFGDGSANNSSWLKKSTFNFDNVFNNKNITANEESPKKSEEDNGSDDEKDTSVVANDNEPYFEPIISLPNLIDVKTGEEEETIEFCERAKLFRFDQDKREWKERGIGEFKLLFHPVQKTYRLLLRREQVHKVVLNQRVTPNLTLQPFVSSPNSWCWFGMNLPEEHPEPVLEKLAIRFKTEEIAQKFERVVSDCVAQLNGENDDNETSSQIVQYGDSEESEDGETNYVGDPCEQDYYVDEEAIGDAMDDVEGEMEVVFENLASLRIFEGDSAADYEGIIRMVRKHADVPESEETQPYNIEFSTADISALYMAEVDKQNQAFLENDCVTILEDNSGAAAERKVTIRFEDKELSEEFFNIYEMLK